MRVNSTLLLCLATLACATAEPVPPEPTRLVTAPARKPPPFDARAFAGEQLTPAECESSARQLHMRNPDQGWEGLKACIDRTRWPHGEFTQLERLTGGFWDADLQSRPDAPRLIAKVIALRGGDVEGDIPLAQKSRVPLFTLAAAMSQPAVYKGRWVLLRGAIGKVKEDQGKAAATVKETSLRATAHEQDVGPTSHMAARGGDVSITNRYYGGGSTTTNLQNGADLQRYETVRRFDNERSETGRQVVARFPKADPFLEPEKDFIFIGRFDGMRLGNEDDNGVALVTVGAYFQPNALMLQ